MKNLILIILLFTTLVGYAQQEIIGKIHNERKTPIKHVQITEKGTNNTVYSDQSGIFNIKVSGDVTDLVVQAKDFPLLELLQIRDPQLEIIMIPGEGSYTTKWTLEPLENTSPTTYKVQVVFKPIDSKPKNTTETQLEDIKPKSDTVTAHKAETVTRLVAIPAVYETVTEHYEEPASTRLVAVPAQYETVTEQVLVSDGGSRLITIPDGKGGMSTREETIEAKYKTITRRILVTPATTRSIDVPAKYGTRTTKVVKTPATTREETLPIGHLDAAGMTSATAKTTPVSPKDHLTKTAPTPKKPQPKRLPEISKASLLSATEINDFSKWEFWQDITENQLKLYSLNWKMSTKQRYCVQVKKENGSPLIGGLVHLLDNEDQIIWTANTDNTGKAELWASLFQPELNGKKIQVIHNEKSYYKKRIKPFQKGINIIELPIACTPTEKAIDIAFVVDATGSMSDELKYIKDELRAIVGQTTKNLPDYSLQLASIFYSDVSAHEELMYAKDFTSDLNDMDQFISERSLKGGGDRPEAVDHALERAMSLNWRDGATSRILFLFLDAPPHKESENYVRLQAAIRKAAAKGIRIIPIGCSGMDASTEYLMRAMALATNGSYVHLTDNSGVGNSHSTPTADKISNELLNKILIRQITQFSKIEDCQPDLEEVVASLESDLEKDKQEKRLKKQDQPDKIDWSFYPNPTTGQLQVKASQPIRCIHVLDNNGKLLKRVLPPTETWALFEIGEFPSAVYLLQVFFEDGQKETGKVVLIGG